LVSGRRSPTKPATCGRRSCRWATSRRLAVPRAGSLVGLSSCWAILRRLVAPPGRPSVQCRWSRPLPRAGGHQAGIILANFVTQVAVGDVNSVRRATRGTVNYWRLDGRAKAYIAKRCRWHCAHFSRPIPEVPLTTMSGHRMGSVDYWLCQNIHQIFGGSPAGYPRLRVESAWASSS
jgi:hypothetical protein